jgi:hypothetical protein
MLEFQLLLLLMLTEENLTGAGGGEVPSPALPGEGSKNLSILLYANWQLHQQCIITAS